MADIYGNVPSTNNIITNGTITNSQTNGTFEVECVNNEFYDLQTPDNGDNGDVLQTDGNGNTFWGPGGGSSGGTFQDVYNTSLLASNPYFIATENGQEIKYLTTPFLQNVFTIRNTAINDYGISADNATIRKLIVNDEISTDDIRSITHPDDVYIDLKSATKTMELFANDLLFNMKPVVYTPYIAPIEGTAFVKTGGLSTQYLMADGTTTTFTNLQEATDASFALGNPAVIGLNYDTFLNFKTPDDEIILNIVAGNDALNDYRIEAERANINNLISNQSLSNTFVKNGGTSNQYLMADGSSLQYSQNSGNSNFYLYDNSDGITTPPPPSGHIGYNNADQASATLLYISHLTSA